MRSNLPTRPSGRPIHYRSGFESSKIAKEKARQKPDHFFGGAGGIRPALRRRPPRGSTGWMRKRTTFAPPAPHSLPSLRAAKRLLPAACRPSNLSELLASKKPHPDGWGFSLAEKERFELSRPFWGLRDFQSRALDQTTRLLHVLLCNRSILTWRSFSA